MALSRIDGLLSENNTESYLYNLMWNVFPHVTPINCPVASATAGGDKAQLGNLLQKVIDGLDIYSKVSSYNVTFIDQCFTRRINVYYSFRLYVGFVEFVEPRSNNIILLLSGTTQFYLLELSSLSVCCCVLSNRRYPCF